MDIYENILLYIRTTHELDELLSKIDEMLSAVYKTDTSALSQIFTRELSADLSNAFRTTLSEQQIELSNQEGIKNFLSHLKTILSSSSILTLTLAFSPSDETLSLFSRKVKELFGSTTVLEISVHETILGGAIIVYKGKYLDYSLRTRLDTAFKTKSKDIIGVLSDKNKIHG